jgi:hypothetical protein
MIALLPRRRFDSAAPALHVNPVLYCGDAFASFDAPEFLNSGPVGRTCAAEGRRVRISSHA